MIIDGPPSSDAVERLIDELAWSRSAQHRLLTVLDQPTLRKVSDAWRQLINRQPRLRTVITELHRQLEALRPGPGSDRQHQHLAYYLFTDLLDPVEETAELDRLEHALAQDYPGATPDDVDEEAVGLLLGFGARRRLLELRRIARTLSAERDPRPRIRRRLPRMALRRALTPELRRQLATGPDADPDDPGVVLLVIDRAAVDPTDWAAIRAVALAVPALIRRYRPADALEVLVIDGSGAVRRVGPATIADLPPVAETPNAPLDSGRVIGAIRRAAARSSATRATALLIGPPRTDRELDRAQLHRLNHQPHWSMHHIQVPPPGPPDRHRVTETIRQAIKALTPRQAGRSRPRV